MDLETITKGSIYSNFCSFYQDKVFKFLVGEYFFDPQLREVDIFDFNAQYMRLQHCIKKRGLIDVFTLNILIWLEVGSDLLIAGFAKLLGHCDNYIEKYIKVYHVSLKSIDSINNLSINALGEKSHLIKAGNNYYIWGYKEGTWQLTQISSADIEFDWPEAKFLSISYRDKFYNTFKNNHQISEASWAGYLMIVLAFPIISTLILISMGLQILARIIRPLLGVVCVLPMIPFVKLYAYFEYRRCVKTIRCAEPLLRDKGVLDTMIKATTQIEDVFQDPNSSIKNIEVTKTFQLRDESDVIKLLTYTLDDILKQKKKLYYHSLQGQYPHQEWFYSVDNANNSNMDGIRFYCIPFLTQEFQQYRKLIFLNSPVDCVLPSAKDWNKKSAELGQQTLMLICILRQRSGEHLMFAEHILDYLIDTKYSDIKLKDMAFPCMTKNAHLFFTRKALAFYTTRSAAKGNEENLEVGNMLQTSDYYNRALA